MKAIMLISAGVKSCVRKKIPADERKILNNRDKNVIINNDVLFFTILSNFIQIIISLINVELNVEFCLVCVNFIQNAVF